MDYIEIVSQGLSAIFRLVETRAEETHRLDFKRKTDPSSLDLSREDKKGLGEAASGFSNAEGGLLIIGVQTESHQGVDRAKAIIPIKDVVKVADRYRSYLAECVSPPNDDIQISPVVGDDDAGAILIHIPQGRNRPYMSRAPDHHRFYRRTSDRFQQMERYEIEEMFRLVSNPSLDLVFEYEHSGSFGGNPQSKIYFGLVNESRTIGKYPYISIDHIHNGPSVSIYGLDGNGNTPWPRRPSRYSHEIVFSGGADAVIHPSQVIMVSYFDYLHELSQREHKWSAASLANGHHFSLLVSFGCENFERQKREVIFSEESLLYHQQPFINVVA